MSNLSEDEIIDRVMMIEQWKTSGDIYTQDELNAIGQFIDLYNKEKQKNTFKDNKVRNLIAELDKQKEIYDEKIKQVVVAVIKLLKRTLLEETNE